MYINIYISVFISFIIGCTLSTEETDPLSPTKQEYKPQLSSYNTNMERGLAIIIGINYYGTNAGLRGCINDATNLKHVLMDKFSLLEDNIMLLTDTPENLNTDFYPTANNIRKAIRHAIDQAKNGLINKIWISYSGHGISIKDYSGDEIDGMDEALCPVDYSKTEGRTIRDRFIFDDELYATLSQLPQYCSCFILSDCCHSGTILDTKYMYDFENHRYKKQTYRKYDLCPSKIVCVSGCRDDQTSADAYIKKEYTGAMTFSFIQTLAHNNILNYEELVVKMRETLKDKNFKQVPQLTSSYKVPETDLFYINSATQVMFGKK